MKQEAIPLGLKLIEPERELNDHFASLTITDEVLRQNHLRIAQVHGKMRYVHLSANLRTPDILNSDHIALYNNLRGYSSGNPCEKVPKGHDPVMWKKHHNCP